MIIFRSRLKARRKELGLTQEELGKKIYLSKGEICAYEGGKRIPPLDVLIRLASFLKVDFVWLIGMELKCIINEDNVVNLSSADLEIITEIKKNNSLYERFLENPERTVNQINNILNK